MPRVQDKIDITKVTKGGDADGVALVIGTTDAYDLTLMRGGVTGFEIGATATTISGDVINLDTTGATGGIISLGVAGETGSIAVISVANKTAVAYATEIVGIPSAIPNVKYIDNALATTTLGGLSNVNSVADTGPTGGDALIWNGTEWLPGNPKLREGEESVLISDLGDTGSIENIGIVTGGLSNDCEILVRVGDPPGTLKHVHLHPTGVQGFSCIPASYGDTTGLTGATGPYAWFRSEDIVGAAPPFVWTPSQTVSSWSTFPVNCIEDQGTSTTRVASLNNGSSNIGGLFVGDNNLVNAVPTKFIILQIDNTPIMTDFTIFVTMSQWAAIAGSRLISLFSDTSTNSDSDNLTSLSVIIASAGSLLQTNYNGTLDTFDENNVITDDRIVVYVITKTGTTIVLRSFRDDGSGEQLETTTTGAGSVTPLLIGFSRFASNGRAVARSGINQIGDVVVYKSSLSTAGRFAVAESILEHYGPTGGPCTVSGLTYPLDTTLGDLANVSENVDTFATNNQTLVWDSTGRGEWGLGPVLGDNHCVVPSEMGIDSSCLGPQGNTCDDYLIELDTTTTDAYFTNGNRQIPDSKHYVFLHHVKSSGVPVYVEVEVIAFSNATVRIRDDISGTKALWLEADASSDGPIENGDYKFSLWSAWDTNPAGTHAGITPLNDYLFYLSLLDFDVTEKATIDFKNVKAYSPVLGAGDNIPDFSRLTNPPRLVVEGNISGTAGGINMLFKTDAGTNTFTFNYASNFPRISIVFDSAGGTEWFSDTYIIEWKLHNALYELGSYTYTTDPGITGDALFYNNYPPILANETTTFTQQEIEDRQIYVVVQDVETTSFVYLKGSISSSLGGTPFDFVYKQELLGRQCIASHIPVNPDEVIGDANTTSGSVYYDTSGNAISVRDTTGAYKQIVTACPTPVTGCVINGPDLKLEYTAKATSFTTWVPDYEDTGVTVDAVPLAGEGTPPTAVTHTVPTFAAQQVYFCSGGRPGRIEVSDGSSDFNSTADFTMVITGHFQPSGTAEPIDSACITMLTSTAAGGSSANLYLASNENFVIIDRGDTTPFNYRSLQNGTELTWDNAITGPDIDTTVNGDSFLVTIVSFRRGDNQLTMTHQLLTGGQQVAFNGTFAAFATTLNLFKWLQFTHTTSSHADPYKVQSVRIFNTYADLTQQQCLFEATLGALGQLTIPPTGYQYLNIDGVNPTTSTTGQVFKFNGVTYENAYVNVNDLGDATISGATGGDILTYNSTSMQWENTQPSVVSPPLLNDLTDVGITSATACDVLKYDGAGWVNAQFDLNSLSDVGITGATGGDILKYNSTTSQWENTTNNVNDLGNVVITDGATGQQLEYDGSDWRNRDTISLFDVGATAGAVADITASTPPGSTGQLSTRVKVYLNGTAYYMYLDPV